MGVNPSKRAQLKWDNSNGADDFLQLTKSDGGIPGWIDSTGIPRGTLSSGTFGTMPGGINTSSLVIGNGGSLSAIGTGTITATNGLIPFIGVPGGTCNPAQAAVDTTTGNLYSCLNGSFVKVGPGASAPNVSLKPSLPGDPVQYVSPNGNDNNDGLSWGSAKLTVYAAATSLPGGSATISGSGTVLLSGTVNYGGPVANQGMWIMSGNDPNFANPPAGWLLFGGPLSIECINKNKVGANARTPACTMVAGIGQGSPSRDLVHPALWLSGIAGGFQMKDVSFGDFLMTYVKIGIDSNNNRAGLGGVSGIRLEGLKWNHGGGRFDCGPGIDIGSNTFWVTLDYPNGSGCSGGIIAITPTGLSRASNVVTVTTATPNIIAVTDSTGNPQYVTIQTADDPSFNGSWLVTSIIDSTHLTVTQGSSQIYPDATSGNGVLITHQAAGINIDAGSGLGSGLIYITNWNLNGGGVRIVKASVTELSNGTFEGNFSTPTMPPVITMNGGTISLVENLEVADTLASGNIPAIQLNERAGGTVINGVRGLGVYGDGIVLLGGTPVFQSSPSISPLRSKMAGIFSSQSGISNGAYGTFIYGGGMDQGRRLFSPTAVISPNLAATNPSSWTISGGTGTITHVADPVGGTNAGRFTWASGGQLSGSFYSLLNTPIAIGDSYVYGAWARSQTANGYSQGGNPLSFGFGGGGFGSGDSCVPGGGILWTLPTQWADGQWTWLSGVCKVYTNPTNAGIGFGTIFDSTHTVDIFSPVLLKFPAGTKSDNEIYEIANNLASWPETASQGEVSMLKGQRFRPGSTVFANLGTPPPGVTFIGCDDCAVTNPCAGSGTGALAKSLNGAWVCN